MCLEPACSSLHCSAHRLARTATQSTRVHQASEDGGAKTKHMDCGRAWLTTFSASRCTQQRSWGHLPTAATQRFTETPRQINTDSLNNNVNLKTKCCGTSPFVSTAGTALVRKLERCLPARFCLQALEQPWAVIVSIAKHTDRLCERQKPSAPALCGCDGPVTDRGDGYSKKEDATEQLRHS